MAMCSGSSSSTERHGVFLSFLRSLDTACSLSRRGNAKKQKNSGASPPSRFAPLCSFRFHFSSPPPRSLPTLFPHTRLSRSLSRPSTHRPPSEEKLPELQHELRLRSALLSRFFRAFVKRSGKACCMFLRNRRAKKRLGCSLQRQREKHRRCSMSSLTTRRFSITRGDAYRTYMKRRRLLSRRRSTSSFPLNS